MLNGHHLTLTILKATQNDTGDTWGKQDPYIKMKNGVLEFQTKVCEDGGGEPTWNETFELKVLDSAKIPLTVFDSDPGSDDQLCEGVFDVSKHIYPAY